MWTFIVCRKSLSFFLACSQNLYRTSQDRQRYTVDTQTVQRTNSVSWWYFSVKVFVCLMSVTCQGSNGSLYTFKDMINSGVEKSHSKKSSMRRVFCISLIRMWAVRKLEPIARRSTPWTGCQFIAGVNNHSHSPLHSRAVVFHHSGDVYVYLAFTLRVPVISARTHAAYLILILLSPVKDS